MTESLVDNDDNIFSEFDSDLARLDSEAEAILNSIRNEGSASENSSVNDSSGDDCCSRADGSDPDDDDDDEMTDEILRLGSVVASIQRDMNKTSVNSVMSALSTVGSPCTKKSLVKSQIEFIRPKRLCSLAPGGKGVSKLLLTTVAFIWAIVIILTLHVKHLSGEDGLDFFPSWNLTRKRTRMRMPTAIKTTKTCVLVQNSEFSSCQVTI